ncbi:MAG TPA: hypothetical protein VGP72_23555 [Planctomycetota bacterium]|jgi:hypothetical protein
MCVSFRRLKVAALAAVGCALLLSAGCKRSEEAMDDRPLEKRSFMETVKPDDRKDAFRP